MMIVREIEPRISEHALLRYIERAHGVDMTLLREHILSPRVVDAIRRGARSVRIDGVKFVIRNFKIVTVLEDGGRSCPQDCRLIVESASSAIARGLADYELDRSEASAA